MTLRYGFFDSQNGDRKYNAGDFGQMMCGFVPNGVYIYNGNEFFVEGTTALKVKVKPGFAFFDGYWINNDSDAEINVPAGGTGNRVDYVVLDYDHTTRAGSVIIVTGVESSRIPIDPTLINTPTHRQIPIARIYMSWGSSPTSIPQGAIEDCRAISTNEIRGTALVLGPCLRTTIGTLKSELEERFEEKMLPFATTIVPESKSDTIASFNSQLSSVSNCVDRVLAQNMYGTTLPASGVEGQLFFLMEEV